MTQPIDPVRRISPRRRDDRQYRPDGADETPNLPAVIAAPEREPPPPPGPAAKPAAAFTAQLLGQEGQKRGLKGGAPVIDAARNAYVTTEWLGPRDRRGRRGAAKRTEI
jgi:hypothetical protein